MSEKITLKKNVKKGFFEVNAPITATKIHLYAPSRESLEGKTIKLDLTKKLRGKSLELKLRIKSENGSLKAEPESLELVKSYIRRVMRKSADYVEDSFDAECRDFLVRVKPLLITRKRVSRAILKELRKSTRKHIGSYIKTRDAKEIFGEIISNKLQKNLALKLKKVYPLALCEIRIFNILKEKEKKEKGERVKEVPESARVEEDTSDVSQGSEE